ncbi:MAG: hypothetical protein WDO12_09225 [Pseudomonadota bacterium]
MSWNLILVIAGGLVAGYAIVSVLMKTGADDLRPPPRDAQPPRTDAALPPPSGTPRALPAPISSSAATPASTSNTSRTFKTSQTGDWTLLLDIPRSAGLRDIEAAFRRQQTKAEAEGDRAMIDRLRAARDAALAEVKGRS